MSTVRTCTTPDEGWALYSHFLGNRLLAIRLHLEAKTEEKDEAAREKIDRLISNAWAQLVGNLYMIMRRMKTNGHKLVAYKMQQIIDMTVELDLTDPTTHEAIHSKQSELDPNIAKFEAELTKIKAQHERK